MTRIIALCIAVFLVLIATATADPIHDAVVAGDTSLVKQLIERDPGLVSAPDTAQSLPLHLAASYGQTAVIKLLLSRGANIDAGDREGTTPLTCAALLNKPDAVRLLVEKGASMTARDAAGTTPLLGAASGGNVETVKYLLGHGASLSEVNARGSNCLHIAASARAEELVRFLLSQGLDVNTANSAGYTVVHLAASSNAPGILRLLAGAGAAIDTVSRGGTTPLMAAGYAGSAEAIQTLVELGADVNHAPNSSNQSPLMAAIWGGNVDMVSYLIDHGADVKFSNSEGETPLFVAAAKGIIPIAQLLISKGIDINIRSNGGLTPLCGSMWGQPQMTRWLIEQGANVNAVDDSAISPLQFSINLADTSIIRLLIERGAKVDFKNQTWNASLYAAVQNGALPAARMLLDAGADPNLISNDIRRTALHVAALNGQKELVTSLLGRGAQTNPADSLGRTPLYYASRYGHKSVADALKSRGATGAAPEEHYGTPATLTEPVREGDAVVWYLGHSGWLIKTSKQLLVFDFWRGNAQPDEPGLVNGFINPSELAGQAVTVFSTHEHADHYDTTIFAWKEQLPNINYVFGHSPRDRQGYLYIGPDETREFPGMKVSTIRSADGGVGFIVEVDGLVIFQDGDNATGQVELPAEFTSQIDNVAARWPKIDMAFFPVRGCSIGTPESVRAGDFYILRKLHPGMSFPEHAMTAERAYFEFRDLAREAGITDSISCAEHRGDMFRYSKPRQL